MYTTTMTTTNVLEWNLPVKFEWFSHIIYMGRPAKILTGELHQTVRAISVQWKLDLIVVVWRALKSHQLTEIFINCWLFLELCELLQSNLFFNESRHICGRYYGRTFLIFKHRSFYEKISTEIINNIEFKNRPNVGLSASYRFAFFMCKLLIHLNYRVDDLILQKCHLG